jgi:hypothetical protein
MRERALAGLLIAVAACGGPGAVRLSSEWPDRAGDYREVTRAWTRKGAVIRDYDTVIEVVATFKSPEWRVAYVEERARAEGLTADEKAALLAAEQTAAQQHWEVELLVSTYDHKENDLQKNDRSMWRIGLIDDGGRLVRPVAIEPDRRTGALLTAYFPHWNPFQRAFVVRFPRTVDVLRDDARKFSLRVASARGSVELTWQGQ